MFAVVLAGVQGLIGLLEQLLRITCTRRPPMASESLRVCAKKSIGMAKCLLLAEGE